MQIYLYTLVHEFSSPNNKNLEKLFDIYQKGHQCMFFALNCWTNILFLLLQKHVLHKCKLAWLWVRFDKCLAERSDSNVLIWWSHAKFQQEKYKEIRFINKKLFLSVYVIHHYTTKSCTFDSILDILNIVVWTDLYLLQLGHWLNA